MGVQKQTLSAGNGVDFPKKNDTVTMEYTGWLYDPSKPDNKGQQYVRLLSQEACQFNSLRGSPQVGRTLLTRDRLR